MKNWIYIVFVLLLFSCGESSKSSQQKQEQPKLAFISSHKKMQKIELKNPQDIYHNEKDNELAIVDFDYGLIIINLSTGDAIGYRLPNDDVPNSLKFVNNFGNKFYIVQARKALYKFDVSNKEFIQIFNQQVSNLTTYYGKAYFTHQGKLNILNV